MRCRRGLEFDASFVGVGGQPFTIIKTQVPNGTPAVPTPAFDTVLDGERVSGLRFDFGDWLFRPGATLTILIQVRLEAGVTVGQTIDNVMGATSPIDGLQCTAGDPVVSDASLGTGQFCTDDATVTVQAGAAFSARKWVAGRDSLGWYNTRTKARVTPGSSACPSTRDAENRRYTAYPCIALVNPGDSYDYLLRLTNAGTEPARQLRVIDRLPVAGDRGVILDQARLTEWNHRPTLASEPVLDGASPGSLTNSYTDDADLCNDDLDMHTADCPAGAWDDAFAPSNTGVQMRVVFGTRLAPGGTIALKFSMDTPLDVARVGDPTIAWNSFTHAETTVRANGRDNILPPTEPIKTGVGLAYGTLDVAKTIGANPSQLPVENLQFEFGYACTITPAGGEPREVAAGILSATSVQTSRLEGLPGGARCRVWETQDFGGVSSHLVGNPLVVTIEAYVPGDESSVTTATINNDFPDGDITVTKTVVGAAATYGLEDYPVDVFCTFRGVAVAGFDPRSVTVSPGESEFILAVPPGSLCHAVETDRGGATAVTYLPARNDDGLGSGDVVTASGTSQSIRITNDFRAGSLVINKELTGPGAPELSDGPFVFSVSCRFDGRDVFTDAVTLAGDHSEVSLSSEPITDLPVGALCTVTEVDSGGADALASPVIVTVPDEILGEPQTVIAGFTNTFSAGTVTVTKVLAGAGSTAAYATGATYTVQVRCARLNGDGALTTVLDEPVQVSGGRTVDVTDGSGAPVLVPLGSHCWGAETDPGGATSSTVDFDSYENAAVVTTSGEPQVLALTATNTFDVGTLRMTKTLAGGAASFAAGRPFTMVVNCALRQGEAYTPVLVDEVVTLVGGASTTLEGLPIGARCWAAETDSGGASSVTILADSLANGVVVDSGSTAAIEVTNTFDPGVLRVSKRVVQGGPGPYAVTVACTVDGGDVALPVADRAFSLRANQSRDITVPIGATCTVAEPNPGSATVTFADSDTPDDGTVVVGSAASVTVTNDYTPPPPPPPPPPGVLPGGETLPNTGGPASVLLLLLLATMCLGGGSVLVRQARVRRR